MPRRSTPSRTSISVPACSLSDTRWVPQRVYSMIEFAFQLLTQSAPGSLSILTLQTNRNPYLSCRRRWANLRTAREDSLRGAENRPLLVRPPKTSEERAVWSPPRAAHLSGIKALLVANLFSPQNRHILPLLLRAALSGAAPVAHLAIVHPPTGGSYEGDDVDTP